MGILCFVFISVILSELFSIKGVVKTHVLFDVASILLSILIGDSLNLPLELIIGSLGILILLEATRRAIGLPLVIIAVCFLLFSYFGRYAPEIISHGGLSLNRLVGFQWLDQELSLIHI